MTKTKLILIHAILGLSISGCHIEDFDACPDNPDKLEPGFCGCDKPDTSYGISDSDNDHVQNCIDACPTDPNKTQPGFCGCNVTDTYTKLKEVPDCIIERIDLCPDDPNKSWPGACGCGNPDIDENLNQEPDCIENDNDACPDDPNKTAPGVCGCGTPDTIHPDTNLPQCIGDDFCPDDPDKKHPGTCGCGMPDLDIDNDTIVDCAIFSDGNCQNDQTRCNSETQPLICQNGIWYNKHPCEENYICKDGECIKENTNPSTCGSDIPKCIGNTAVTCVKDAIQEKDCGTQTCYQGQCLDDQCPTSEKVEPGICGCEQPDTDSDGDKTPDCKDYFPHDPNLTNCDSHLEQAVVNGQPYCGYKIKTAEDFIAFRDAWNAGEYANDPIQTWILEKNDQGEINFNKLFNEKGLHDSWEGIKDFSGTFIGNGQKLTFIQDGFSQSINCSTGNCAIFASIVGTETKPARVSDLKLQFYLSNNNTDATTPSYTGVLAGYTQNAIVSDIVLENVNIKTTQNTAGTLIGYAENTHIETIQIHKSYIEGTSEIGGLVGSAKNISAQNIHIKDLTFIQKKNAECSQYGGLAGKSEHSNYTNLDVETEMINKSCTSVGGLIGYSLSNTIQSAQVTGTINEKKYVGGMIGKSEIEHTDSLSNASAALSITSNQIAGGIIGYANANTTLDQITCNSDITSSISIGGLIAVTNGETHIKNSQYRGTITTTSGTSCSTTINDEDLKGGKRSAGGIIANYLASTLNIENVVADTQMILQGCTAGGIIGFMNMSKTAGLTHIQNTISKLSVSNEFIIQSDTYLGGAIGEIIYKNLSDDINALRAINLNKLYTYTNTSLIGSSSYKIYLGGVIGQYDATATMPAGKQFILPLNLSNIATIVSANNQSYSNYGGGIFYKYSATFREKTEDNADSADFFPTLNLRNISINLLNGSDTIGIAYHYEPNLSSITNPQGLERYYDQYPHKANNVFVNQIHTDILFHTYRNYLQLKNIYNTSTDYIINFCKEYKNHQQTCTEEVILPETNAVTGGFTDPALPNGSIIEQLNKNISQEEGLNPEENEKWIMLETKDPNGKAIKFPAFEFVKSFIDQENINSNQTPNE